MKNIYNVYKPHSLFEGICLFADVVACTVGASGGCYFSSSPCGIGFSRSPQGLYWTNAMALGSPKILQHVVKPFFFMLPYIKFRFCIHMFATCFKFLRFGLYFCNMLQKNNLNNTICIHCSIFLQHVANFCAQWSLRGCAKTDSATSRLGGPTTKFLHMYVGLFAKNGFCYLLTWGSETWGFACVRKVFGKKRILLLLDLGVQNLRFCLRTQGFFAKTRFCYILTGGVQNLRFCLC